MESRVEMNQMIEQKFIFNGASFKNLTFEKGVDFSNARFEDNVYFNNTEFKKEADFHESEYGRIACFYGVTFLQTPNFSQSIFKGSLNLVNSNLEFDFDKTRDAVKKEGERRSGGEQKKSDVANDFRDSFRGFKSVLIKDNNLLDAQEHHRIELYCKEIELDSRLKESWNWRDWIDKWQLRLYRYTSDHHTDLLRIISWVIVAIGIFGLLLFACKYGMDLKTFIDNHSKNTFVTLFDTSIITQNKIVMWFVYALGFFSLFWKWIRIVFFSSITLCMTLVSYKYILGVGSFLTSKASTNPIENLLLVLYTLVMILLLFSLQKTARKNSIVPS